MGQNETVVVLGASSNPERYSYKAITHLLEKGHQVIPVHPKEIEIQGIAVQHDITSISKPIHTLSIYLNPEKAKAMVKDLLKLKPTRVILNPGTESPELEKIFGDHGIEVVKGCTIVMLKTDQF